MNDRMMKAALAPWMVVLMALAAGCAAPTATTVVRQGVLYFGTPASEVDTHAAANAGQMFVFVQRPAARRAPLDARRYPMVFIHGSQQTGANFLGTPDGRAGWAEYFVGRGWTVYVVDEPGRGKSGYWPQIYGAQGSSPRRADVAAMFTAPENGKPLQWPQAALHTQWPGGAGGGVPGQLAFEQFFASQVANMPDVERLYATTRAAMKEMLDSIGPVILVTHSQAGPLGWMIAQDNPGKVKAIVALEPSGSAYLSDDKPSLPCGLTISCLAFEPAVTGPEDLHLTRRPSEGPGLNGCWLQEGPVHTLPWLARTPILIATGEASYHAAYDHCTARFLSQAGVPNDYVYLPTVGIKGNGHMLMLELNNLEIARFYESWLLRRLP